MKNISLFALILLLLQVTASTTRADASSFELDSLDAQPTACIKAELSSTGSNYWRTVALKITNNCGVDLNFQNSLITFTNTTNLNTSAWASMGPLAYPDSGLQISSSPMAGKYLASLPLHFPEQSWANTKLPHGKFFIVFYGVATPSYDPASARVYLGASPPVIENPTVNIQVSVDGLPVDRTSVVVTFSPKDNSSSVSTTVPLSNGQGIGSIDLLDGYDYNVTATPVAGYTVSIAPQPLFATSGASVSVHYEQASQSTGRIIGYLPGWKTPPPVADLAHAGYTHIMVAFGVFSTTQPGQIVSAFDTVTAAYVAALHNAGIKVLLSLGGASTSIPNTSVDFHQVLSMTSPSAFQSTFIQSVANLVNQYGFDGIDIDIEHGINSGGTFSQPTGDIAMLASIINQLHANDPNFLITLTPQVANISATSGFDATWGNYASLIMQCHSSLAWVGIQLYNAGCAFGIDHVCYDPNVTSSPNFSVAMATDLLENWPSKDAAGRSTGFQPYIAYLSPSQVVLGYPAPNSSGNSDGTPVTPISTIKNAIKCLRTGTSCGSYVPPRTYPGISGVFNWEVTYDQNNRFGFATGLSACVKEGNCN